MSLQLTRCRVRNFRSISDSNLFPLSDDNITGIIGQNESGKTSILEALSAFATDEISNEVLRSDGSMPEVTCVFKLPNDWPESLFPDIELPTGLVKAVKESDNQIAMTRTWHTEDESEVLIDNIQLDNFLPIVEETPDTLEPNTSPTDTAIPTPSPAPSAPASLTKDEFIEVIFDSMPRFDLFMDFSNLLPDTIDVADVIGKNIKVEGYQGAVNFLKLVDLDVTTIDGQNPRVVKNKIDSQNRKFTANFQDFWSQKIGGKDKIGIEVELDYHSAKTQPEKAGKPYLSFWIYDNGERLRPQQRSKGVRWFLSFYLQLRASAKAENESGLILLIDEPAGSLHAKAQEDVLKVFEQLRGDIQIIYTTHSPYLLDLDRIYRLVAAQRESKEGDEYSPSDTTILTAHELGAASTDTLTPIFGCMGVNLAHQNVIEKKNNIIVEEISVCYYLQALMKLKETTTVSFLPATGTPNINSLANLLLGWGIKFGILVDDEDSGKRVIRKLRADIFPDNAELGRKLFREIKGCNGIEDILTKSDFAKYIAEVKLSTITVSNSKYVEKAGLSKGFCAVKFLKLVENGTITYDTLEKESKKNLDALYDLIQEILTAQASS